MKRHKLTNNEEIVLRLLFSGKMNSLSIPEEFFGEEEKEGLTGLGLLSLNPDATYTLTEKAMEAVASGGFIVKYPLHDEQGVVMNFVDILNSYSNQALKALGKSILSTEIYKRWGKQNNEDLLQALKESAQYYSNFEHPVTTLANYSKETCEAQSNYEREVKKEFSRITLFTLKYPISLGLDSAGNFRFLVEYLGSNKGHVLVGNTILLIDFNTDSDYIMTTHVKHAIVEQFYENKSKAG